MAQIPNQISDIIDKYIRALEKEHIHVQRAVLFGSHADGKADEWSDIDIALLSDAFKGIDLTIAARSDASPFL